MDLVKCWVLFSFAVNLPNSKLNTCRLSELIWFLGFMNIHYIMYIKVINNLFINF